MKTQARPNTSLTRRQSSRPDPASAPVSPVLTVHVIALQPAPITGRPAFRNPHRECNSQPHRVSGQVTHVPEWPSHCVTSLGCSQRARSADLRGDCGVMKPSVMRAELGIEGASSRLPMRSSRRADKFAAWTNVQVDA